MTMTGAAGCSTCCGDHRPDRKRFAGIVIQQMDMDTGRLLGERRRIFDGTPLGFTEGPHLYKRDGWYHLLVARGRDRARSCRDDGAFARSVRAL